MFYAGGDFAWKSIEYTTDDGYIQTVFRVTGDPGGNDLNVADQGPVIFRHGFSQDSNAWFAVVDQTRPPTPISMYMRGYDVYLAQSRGSDGSRSHETLDPANEDFWAWTAETLAKYEVPALLEAVQAERASLSKPCLKANLVNSSAASPVAFIALDPNFSSAAVENFVGRNT